VNAKNFFAELKRRNVYKVAIAYAVAGWALAQGIAQVFPLFDVPNWALRLITWAFEATPEGIKRTEVADAMPAATSGHKKSAWIISPGTLPSWTSAG
jgi:hypothetical protein